MRFKSILWGALLAMVALWASVGLAQAQAPKEKAGGAPQYKIGVVDMKTLVAEYDKRKSKYEALQKEVDELQAPIDEMSRKIEAAKKDYEEKKDTMTEEERFDMRSRIQADFAVYQSELKKRQQLIDSKEERVLMEVMKDIQEAVDQIAEKENYHLVLNAGTGARQMIVYHSPSIDITSKVLAVLNSDSS